MNTLEKAELTASIHNIARFLKSEIQIFHSEVPDTAGGIARRRPQTIAKTESNFLLNMNQFFDYKTLVHKFWLSC